MYQVSPPCVVWYVGLRSEEVVIEKSAQGHFDSHHGNTEINACTKFRLHAL